MDESTSTRQRLASAGVVVAVLALIVVGATVSGTRADRAAGTTATRGPTLDDARVLARVPAAGDPTTRTTRALEQQLQAQPGDLATAARLARLHVETSRRTGDVRLLGQAEAALGPWWPAPEPPLPVLGLRATIRQARHDFAGALGDLDRLVARAPDEPQAWLTRAAVLTVVGQYQAAQASCDRLAPLVSPLLVAACRAPLQGLTGGARAARRTLQALLPTATGAAEAAWVEGIAAELARWAGDEGGAEAHFRRALAQDPRDRYVRDAWADLLLDRGRPAEVTALLAGREDDDGALLRLALAEAARGGPRTAALSAAVRARFAEARRRGTEGHQREEARFALALQGDPARALALARAGWDSQHEPWDARLLLEAALAAGQTQAAAPVLAWLARTGFEDPRLRTLAGRLGGLAVGAGPIAAGGRAR